MARSTKSKTPADALSILKRRCSADDVGALLGTQVGWIWKTDKEMYYTPYKEIMDGGFDSLAVFIKHAHAAGINAHA